MMNPESDLSRWWLIDGRWVPRICGGEGEGDGGDPAPVTGGPGDPAQAFGVEVTFGDVKFRVPKEAADALAARQAEFDRKAQESATRIDDLGNQVTELTNRAPTTTLPETTVEAPSYGATLFEDPEGTIARIMADTQKAVTTELRGEYQAAENLKQFWDEFYGSNEDLKGDKFIVDAMFTSQWPTLGQLKRVEAITKLGDMVRERLVAYKGDPPAASGEPKEIVVEAGVSGAVPKPAAAAKGDDKVVSLSQQLKDNKIRKRKAGGSAAA